MRNLDSLLELIDQARAEAGVRFHRVVVSIGANYIEGTLEPDGNRQHLHFMGTDGRTWAGVRMDAIDDWCYLGTDDRRA